MKTNIPIIPLILVVLLSACNIKDKKTTLKVKDPHRHYYPVLQGQELDIQYQIENTGESPLFITDIQTSCGCVEVNKSSLKVLPSKGKGFIRLKYNSNKNTGYVKHYITLYANLQKADTINMTFDVNVVPESFYTKDYEELYREYLNSHLDVKELVDGRQNELRYYVKDK